MPFRLLLPGPLALDPLRRRKALEPQESRVAGRVCRRFPGHALPFEAFPSSAAVPSSPTGVALSPVQAAAAGRRSGCEPRSPTPLASAGLKALLRCRSPVPVLLLPTAPVRCSHGLVPEEGGRSASAEPSGRIRAGSRDRSQSSSRTRVHRVNRPKIRPRLRGALVSHAAKQPSEPERP